MAENNYKKELIDIRSEIKLLEEEMRKLDLSVINLSKNARKAFSTMKSISPQGLTTQLREQQIIIEKLTIEVRKQQQAIDKLTAAKKRKQQATAQEIVGQRELRKNALLEATATTKIVGAYDRLNARRKQAKKVLQDLIAGEKASEAQLKKAQRQYDILTAKVNKANRATSNFTNTSLYGIARGFRNLLGAFGIVGGVQIFADLARSAFNLSKRLQSLRYSMEIIIPDAMELARTQEFLTKTADDYGANIVTLTERYIKFLAAAKQSNFSLESTQEIFQSITKAAGALGLSQDDLNGTFLALEQMISKGKVTTEELRRQLGERLPGAFGIMAKALGVTVDELDDMLRKGEILSETALPKFAKALEEAYGIENQNRIETVVAAQTRMNNAWARFITLMSEGEGSGLMITILNNLAKSIDFVNDVSEKLFLTYDEGLSTMDKAILSMNNLSNIASKTVTPLMIINDWLGINTVLFQEQADEIIRNNKEMAIQAKEADKLNTAYIALNGSLAPLVKQQKESDFNFPFLPDSDKIDKVRTYADVLAEISEQQELLKNSSTEEAGAILDEIDRLNEEAEAWKRSKKAREEVNELMKGSLDYFEDQVSALEKELSGLVFGTQAYEDKKKAIDEAKEALREYYTLIDPTAARGEFITTQRTEEERTEVASKTFGVSFPFDADPAVMAVEELNEAILRTAQATEIAQKKMAEMGKAREFRKNAQESMFMVMDSFSEMYKIDLDEFKFLFDEKENTFEDWASAGKEMVDFVLDSRLHGYEVELQEAIKTRDLILHNELATEEQKRLARRKFEEEEARIKNEKARKERENALIQIAIDTALAVTKSLPNFVLAGIVSAMGLAQAAFVASQPLPQFAEGHLAGTHEGKAMINDANRSDYKEVVERRSGEVEVYKDRNAIIDMKKGDKVHKSFSSFLDYHNMNDMEKDIWMMNLQSMAGNTQSGRDRDIVNKLSALNNSFNKTSSEVKKLASRPIQNTVKVVQPRKPYYG